MQVGCGAIGCEMLKNFALLGVGTDQGRGMVCFIFHTDFGFSKCSYAYIFPWTFMSTHPMYYVCYRTCEESFVLLIFPQISKECSATDTHFGAILAFTIIF